MPSTPRICPGPVSRRSFLEIGSLAVGGLGLSQLLQFRAGAAESASPSKAPPHDTSIIFVWLPGGPPHMETYDLKPEAPLDYRGEFKPIPTATPGLEVCEH